MPLIKKKEKKILRAMKKPKNQGGYGSKKKAEQVFYASKNKGIIKGVCGKK